LTIVFTIEYVLRLISVRRPLRYAMSFFGVIDLLAIVPTYASLFMPGVQYLLAIQILRLLRIFRILKLAEYVSEAEVITSALRASAKKISVFLLVVLALVTIIGSIMYVIEGEENGFNDIPTSIYWAIVTLTTVGYGDLSPQTAIGKAFASLVMIMGYAIIAVPTELSPSSFRVLLRKLFRLRYVPNAIHKTTMPMRLFVNTARANYDVMKYCVKPIAKDDVYHLTFTLGFRIETRLNYFLNSHSKKCRRTKKLTSRAVIRCWRNITLTATFGLCCTVRF